jgi:hypothetical protein
MSVQALSPARVTNARHQQSCDSPSVRWLRRMDAVAREACAWQRVKRPMASHRRQRSARTLPWRTACCERGRSRATERATNSIIGRGPRRDFAMELKMGQELPKAFRRCSKSDGGIPGTMPRSEQYRRFARECMEMAGTFVSERARAALVEPSLPKFFDAVPTAPPQPSGHTPRQIRYIERSFPSGPTSLS